MKNRLKNGCQKVKIEKFNKKVKKLKKNWLKKFFE